MKTEIEQNASFNIMRYGQCWEDADILLDALKINRDDVCLSIASAGENSFSLLSQSPKKVIAIDMNPIQLYAVELRKYVYLNLSHSNMLKLHGATFCTENERKDIYHRVKHHLPLDCKEYWESTDFLKVGYANVGKFEKYFRLFKDNIIPLTHGRKKVDRLFALNNITLQQNYYHEVWNNWRWKLLFKLFFSRKIMGLMGRDPAFFKYVEGSVADKILSRTELCFQNVLAKENPYLDWILHGEFKYSLPHALRKENYDAIRDNLHKLELHLGSIESYFKIKDEPITKYNLSDIFEYMSEEMYEQLMLKLIHNSQSGGILAYWNMLAPRHASISKILPDKVNSLDTQELFLKDKAFFYSNFVAEEIK